MKNSKFMKVATFGLIQLTVFLSISNVNADTARFGEFSPLTIDGTTADVIYENDFEQGVGSLNLSNTRITTDRTTEDALNGAYSFKVSSRDYGGVWANHDYKWGEEIYGKALQIHAKAHFPEALDPRASTQFCAVAYQVGSLRTQNCHVVPGSQTGDVMVDVTLDLDPAIRVTRLFYYVQFKGYSPYKVTVDDMHLVFYRVPIDSDGDGIEDSDDTFPNDASETTDTDGDGVGDNADDLPNDATATKDTDGDGVGDNADAFPNDSAKTNGFAEFSPLSLEGTTAEVIYENDFEQGIGALNVSSSRITSERTTDSALNGNYSFKINSGDYGSVYANRDYKWGAEIYGKAVQIYAKAHIPEVKNPKGKVNFCAVAYQVGSLRTENCQTIPGTQTGDVTVDVTLDLDPAIRVTRLFSYIQFKGYGPYNMTVDDMHLVFHRTDDSSSMEPTDSDGDGIEDSADTFPNDSAETTDTDGDGVGNNADAFPNDAAETKDSDVDGVGDNADAFPNDAAESKDSDGDGVGDNADAFPNDATETKDSDVDGVGDNADAFPNDSDESKDSDDDGVGDNADAFPNDATETKDTDGDGIGDNADDDFALLSIEGTTADVIYENDFEQGIGALNVSNSRVTTQRTTDGALNGAYSFKISSRDYGGIWANHDYKWGEEIYGKALQIHAKAHFPEALNPRASTQFCAVAYQVGSLRTQNCHVVPGSQTGDVTVDVTLDLDPAIRVTRLFYYVQFKGYSPYKVTVDDMHLVFYRIGSISDSQPDPKPDSNPDDPEPETPNTDPVIEVDLAAIAELGSGSDVDAGKFFLAAQTAGQTTFKVMPIESVDQGENVRITFGVPFPKGYLADVNNFVIKDQNGNEVPVFVKTTLPWRNLAEGTTMGSIRSVMVQMDTRFIADEYGILEANSYTLEWGTATAVRSFAAINQTPVKDDWVLVDDQNYPAEYAIYEPKAFAVFEPQWYGDSVIKTRVLPLGSHHDFSGYDNGFTLFGDTLINRVDPRVADENLQPYLTSYANWLFDRAQSLYQLGFRSGELRFIREAHRAAQFYAAQITPQGYFGLKPFNDLKYVYGESLLSNYMLQGDDSLPAKVASMIPVWGTFTSKYSTKLNFWTERHAAFKLLGYVSAYELLGTPELAGNAKTTFGELVHMQNNPPEGVPFTGGLMHTGAQGSEGGGHFITSPWMSTLLIDAVERFYLHSGDSRVPDFVMQMADFFKRDIALRDTPFGSRRHKAVYYLLGEEHQRADEDWEHTLDVAKIMALAYYFSNQESGDIVTDNAKEYLQTLATLYGTQVDFTFNKWLRTTAPKLGHAGVRLSPPRKFSWWFRTTSNMDFLVGEKTKVNEFDGVTIPQLSLVQSDFEQTHYAAGDEMMFDFTLTNTGKVAAKNLLIVLSTVSKSGYALEVVNSASDSAIAVPTGKNKPAWRITELKPGSAPIKFSLTVRAKDFEVLQTVMRPATPIISFGEVRYCGMADGSDICEVGRNVYNTGTQPNLQQSNWHVVLPVLPLTTPELEITSHSDGANVSGSEIFVADVSDVDGVAKVEFYLDDELLDTLLEAPYEVSYQTDSLSDNTHKIKVVAIDRVGSVAQQEITITPLNPDVVEPTVVINSPTASTYGCQAIDVNYAANDLYSTASCELIVDDIAVELAQCQNYQLPVVTQRLKARLSLSFDGSDEVAVDDSRFATHGVTVNGATSVVTAERSVMSFDGDDDYLKFDDHQLDISNDVTMAFWMNPSRDEGMIMSQEWWYIGTENGWAILLGANNDRNNNTRSISWSSADRKGNYNHKAVVQTEANVITLNAWQHVAITKHDKEVVIYINGIEKARGDIASSEISWAPLASKVLTIGNKMKHPSMYNKNYQGALDDVLIWNEALSAETISQVASNSPNVGNHSLTIKAIDPAGNVGSASVDYKVEACN